MIKYIKEDSKNIISNIAAIFVFAQTLYPGLNGEMIIASIQSGTIIQAIINIGLCYILANYGKATKA